MFTSNAGDSKDTFQMTSGHTSGSRWGIKASEKLNADWTLRAHLESGIESDTGEFSSADRIFGRQMTLSLKNESFGEIAFGRSGRKVFRHGAPESLCPVPTSSPASVPSRRSA